jgi:thiamine-monophosphate kinase
VSGGPPPAFPARGAVALTEFELIRRFTRGTPGHAPGVVLGIGDDAAVLRPPAGEDLVVTVDAVVEGVHFDAGFRPEEVGWKALAVNLSDLAAMGARPRWALCALAVPRGAPAARLARVGRGLAACARRFGVTLVGGNVTRAAELSLTVTALGSVRRGLALTRSGARPGDRLLVSGSLGGAALGLHRRAPAAARRRQHLPEPRLELGRSLGGVASACIDLSDGLIQDLNHLLECSGAGARVRAAALPIDPALRRPAAGDPRLLELALAGGEDYELLAAVPPSRLARALRAAGRAGVALTPIGEVVRGSGLRLLDASGKPIRLARGGYDHLLGS